jgi:hypothetical protein
MAVEELTDCELDAMRAFTGGPVAEQINRRLQLGRYATRRHSSASQVVTTPRRMTAMDALIRRELAPEPELSLRAKLALLAGYEIGEVP